ncbi:MAG: hypothetical protein DSZ03_01860 [Sulfurimonas sp.]|nr:MAG: hypothetical protein DSZ03_01860 [Sulfurimonas sp.]
MILPKKSLGAYEALPRKPFYSVEYTKYFKRMPVNHNSNNTIDIDTLYTVADQFIDLANTLSQEAYTPNTVGSAFRYAATRFSAFEASLINFKNLQDGKTEELHLLKMKESCEVVENGEDNE